MIQTPNGLHYDDYLADSHRRSADGLRALGFARHHRPYPDRAAFALSAGVGGGLDIPRDERVSDRDALMREEKRNGDIAFGPSWSNGSLSHRAGLRAAAIFIYWLACFAIEPLPGDYESFMERLPYFLTFLPGIRTGTGTASSRTHGPSGSRLNSICFFHRPCFC